jgi:hypothetical protein
MIPKSGRRFSEKIMLKQQAKAKYLINLKSFRFSWRAKCLVDVEPDHSCVSTVFLPAPKGWTGRRKVPDFSQFIHQSLGRFLPQTQF